MCISKYVVIELIRMGHLQAAHKIASCHFSTDDYSWLEEGNCTNATDTTGWTEFPRPMVKVSIFCRRRCRRCFRAFLFVKMKPTRSRLISNPFTWATFANILMVRLASNARPIDMLRVENGMVLVIVGELLTWAGSGLWRQRTKISEQKRKRARPTKIAWT